MIANSQRPSSVAGSLANAERVAGPDGDVYCAHKMAFDGAYTVTNVDSTSVGTGTLGDATSLTVQSVSIAFISQPAEGGKLTAGASGSQSIFDSLGQAIAALQLPDSSQGSAQGTTALFVARGNINQGRSRLVEARTSIASRLNEVDAATTNDSARGAASRGESPAWWAAILLRKPNWPENRPCVPIVRRSHNDVFPCVTTVDFQLPLAPFLYINFQDASATA
jgi:hypothetical protein